MNNSSGFLFGELELYSERTSSTRTNALCDHFHQSDAELSLPYRAPPVSQTFPVLADEQTDKLTASAQTYALAEEHSKKVVGYSQMQH